MEKAITHEEYVSMVRARMIRKIQTCCDLTVNIARNDDEITLLRRKLTRTQEYKKLETIKNRVRELRGLNQEHGELRDKIENLILRECGIPETIIV